MPWQTVDARPQKRRKGDAVEDAERRELRLRRTYNEAAAGHAALAAKAASAPPADAVAALYEKILEDVGSAAKENEAPWDAALRLACARHLSELLEAAGDAGSVAECDAQLAQEVAKREMWSAENVRRHHNYVPLVVDLFKVLAEQGKLQDMVAGARKKAASAKAK